MPALIGANLLQDIRSNVDDERFETLAVGRACRVERIVSTGQATPVGEWYDPNQAEWVMVVQGNAKLLIDGEAAPRALGAGDYILLPAHCRHRVDWTDPNQPTIWLAVHFDEAGD